MAEPDSWGILEEDFSTTSGWISTRSGDGAITHIAKPGCIHLSATGTGSAAMERSILLQNNKMTVDFMMSQHVLNDRAFTLSLDSGAGYYSAHLQFSKDGIYVEGADGYEQVWKSGDYVEKSRHDMWRIIHYPVAGKVDIYRNGFLLGKGILSDVSAVRTAVEIGMEDISGAADVYVSQLNIANGAYAPDQVFDELLIIDGVGTYIWNGLDDYYKVEDVDGELEYFVKEVGGVVDPDKALIENSIKNLVDVDDCQERFLPWLGGLTGYEYDHTLDPAVNRNEIRHRIPVARLDHTVRGIKRSIKYLVFKNLLVNGSFENLNGGRNTFYDWDEDGATFSVTTNAIVGDTALQMCIKSGEFHGKITSGYVPIDDSKHYELSFYTLHVNTSYGGLLTAYLDFYNSSYGALGDSFTVLTGYPESFDTQYKKFVGQIPESAIPTSAEYAKVNIKSAVGTGLRSRGTNTQYIDYAILRQKPFEGYKITETEPITARFHGSETPNSLLHYYEGQKHLFSDDDILINSESIQTFQSGTGQFFIGTTDQFTPSHYAAVRVDYYCGSYFRCAVVNTEGNVTYFDSSTTYSGNWDTMYYEFMPTGAGLEVMLYGLGTTKVREVALVDVNPRRKLGQDKFIGRRYAPCTTVVELDAFVPGVAEKLRKHKVGGDQMIVEATVGDTQDVNITLFDGFYGTAPHALAKAEFEGTTSIYG